MSGRESGDREERIRAKAHELWVAEGRPEGQADRHWDAASELIAQEDGPAETLAPEEPATTGSQDTETVIDLPVVDADAPAPAKRKSAASRKKAKV
ncbi:DUF2934 domain-containing protein [Methylobrevis albus]|uniref:DUF2934 domain-containing protein n=1 Tax=Methylobrevis albus TaxID=2793297 RepID=A0A931I178_9HYPH|nr:DUF2934 domain-containing protein [Methylobrevis albus]MBH0237529.1 DUF2934 domain-containing protein [Methylobrevis albus]